MTSAEIELIGGPEDGKVLTVPLNSGERPPLSVWGVMGAGSRAVSFTKDGVETGDEEPTDTVIYLRSAGPRADGVWNYWFDQYTAPEDESEVMPDETP